MSPPLRAAAIAAALLCIAGTEAFSQARNQRRVRTRDTTNPLADTAALTRRQTRATEVAERFWRQPAPLELTVTMNVRRIRGDKGQDAPWRRATVSYVSDTGRVNIPIQVRTRGVWRLRNCSFPPLRFNFPERAVRGTIFEGIDRPKIVSPCDNDDRAERYVLQEFQLYRVHNTITDASHYARLARITYVDSASGNTFMSRWGFLVEEPDAMAARLRGHIVEQQGARASDLEPRTSAILGVFQYLIGNTDFSISNLHNVELVRVDYGIHVPVAYDYDYAGAVQTHYARPPEVLAIRRVTDRLFRGECTPPEDLERAVALVREKKDAIYALYADSIGRLLPPNTVRTTLAFFDEYYRDTADPRVVKRRMMDACLGR